MLPLVLLEAFSPKPRGSHSAVVYSSGFVRPEPHSTRKSRSVAHTLTEKKITIESYEGGIVGAHAERFQRLADLRAREAGSLSKSRNQQGAYYLAGYAVECALKACIAKKTRRHEFPPKRKYVDDVYKHDLNILLEVADLEKQLEKDMRKYPALAANWNTVKVWNEESRYVVSGLNGNDLYFAITGADGVLPWIKKLW